MHSLFQRWWRTLVLMLVLAACAVPASAREALAIKDEITWRSLLVCLYSSSTQKMHQLEML